MKTWEYESELALRAVSQAGERSVERPDNLTFSTKESDRDIVSQMDVSLQQQIFHILKPSGHSIIGEEENAKKEMASDRPCWWVDPLDGTVNYAARIPFYAVSVGLEDQGEFKVGAVAAPAQRELFFTFGQDQSYLNGRLLSVASANMKDSLFGMSFGGQQEEDRQKEMELFQILNQQSRGVLRTGSASLNIAYVACNRMQAAFGFSNRIWDIAGACAVARAAGAKMRIQIGKDYKCRYLVAAESVFDPLVDIIVTKGLMS